MNVFCAIGNLGGDAEVRHTPAGKSVTTFSLPVESGFGDKKKITWVKCSLWGKKDGSPHPVSRFLVKGQKVGVSGEIALEQWTTKEGVERYTLTCTVRNLDLAGTPAQKQPDTAQQPIDSVPDDDIPF